MAADRQEPGDGSGLAGRESERRDEPDHTREFDPFVEDEPEPGDLDRPADQGEGGAGRPAGRNAGPEPVADRTAALPTPGPPTRATTEPRWSARAGVPPPDETRSGRSDQVEWDPEQHWSGRRWWTPILLGLVALLLLAVLAFGIWLIAHARNGETPPTTTETTASSAPSLSAVPTSAAVPTTVPPTLGPSTPVTVPVPPLVGLPQDTARAVLDQLGLAYRLRFSFSEQPPGSVIATEPGVGTLISASQVVTLVIAERPPEQPTTTQPTVSARPTRIR